MTPDFEGKSFDFNLWRINVLSYNWCKHPIIASGLLPSGAFVVHPIEKSWGNIIFFTRIRKHPKYAKNFDPILEYEYSTIALGATPIERANDGPDWKITLTTTRQRSELSTLLSVVNTRYMNSRFTYIGGIIMHMQVKKRIRRFWVFQHPNKALEIKMFKFKNVQNFKIFKFKIVQIQNMFKFKTRSKFEKCLKF
jgi:hypothetical protein